jgi:hypothetical protein
LIFREGNFEHSTAQSSSVQRDFGDEDCVSVEFGFAKGRRSI